MLLSISVGAGNKIELHLPSLVCDSRRVEPMRLFGAG